MPGRLLEAPMRQFSTWRVLNAIDKDAENGNISPHFSLDSAFQYDTSYPYLPKYEVFSEFNLMQLRLLSEAGRGSKGKAREVIGTARRHKSYDDAFDYFRPDRYNTHATVFADGMVRLEIAARLDSSAQYNSVATYKKEATLSGARELVTTWSSRNPGVIYAASIEDDIPVFILQIKKKADEIQEVKKIYFTHFGEARNSHITSVEEAKNFLAKVPQPY